MRSSSNEAATIQLAFIWLGPCRIVAIVVAVGLLNFTGDCAPNVTDCGEAMRYASFVVLGLGLVWIVYIVVRFMRSPTTFR